MADSVKSMVVSVFCPDQVGLVAAITGVLFDLGANLGDTSFAVLGQAAEFTAICEVAEEISADEVREALSAQPELAGARVLVAPFELNLLHGSTGEATHRIEISGGDSPGLLARLSEVFGQFDSNIVRLTTDKQEVEGTYRYTMRINARIAPDRADACLAAVMNTAGGLRLHAEWRPLKPNGKSS